MRKITGIFLLAAALNLLICGVGHFFLPVFNTLAAPALPDDAVIPLAAMIPVKPDGNASFLWCGRPAPGTLIHVCGALKIKFVYEKQTIESVNFSESYDVIAVRELPPLSKVSGNVALLKHWEKMLSPGGLLVMPEKLLRTLLPAGEFRLCTRLPGEAGNNYLLVQTEKSPFPDLSCAGFEKRFNNLLHRLNMDGSTLSGGYGAVYPDASQVFKVYGGNGTVARLTWKFFASFWLVLAMIWTFFRFFTAFRKRLADVWEAGETMAISCALLFWPFYFRVPSAWCFNFAAALLLFGGLGGENSNRRKWLVRFGSVILALSIVPSWLVLSGFSIKFVTEIYLYVPSIAICLLFCGFGILRRNWYGKNSSKIKFMVAEICGVAAGIGLWSAFHVTMLFLQH